MERNLSAPAMQKAIEALRSAKWTALTGVVSLGLVGLWWRSHAYASKKRTQEAEKSDPGLLRKHSKYESYTTQSGYTYPRIRTFYKEHQQAAQLPKDLPLLVFMHGLGGSASQFAPLLTSLINLAPCLAIDLPGCGLSDFAPNNADAYTTHELAELLATAITKYRNAESDQKVILVGHSMGCSIAALLASSTSPISHPIQSHIIGMISICPRATPRTEREQVGISRLAWLPIPVFDLFRWYDRRGGTHSQSVTRMVGTAADDETRKLQIKYNDQSQSAVFLRMLVAGMGSHGLPGRDVWSGIKVPLFLVAGEADTITPSSEVEQVTAWLTTPTNQSEIDSSAQLSALPTTAGDTANAGNHVQRTNDDKEPPRTDSGAIIQDDHTSSKHAFALKTTIFPPPSAHGLMYTTSTVRIVSGMIENFVTNHVDKRLGGAWQLQHLTTSGKWDVKNLTKWKAIDACSAPIGGLFRAMKTMREVDDEHCPAEFVKHFSSAVIPDGVAMVIDISHETPVYRPQGLQDAGVEYYKFPTVSKEKPKAEEVDHFIAIVDRLLESPKLQPSTSDGLRPTIGVHCHYGFNRTGFFIVCYLVERKGYKLQDAVEEFKLKRAPGLKHEHFINELYVRYAVKMERRGTVVER